MNLSVILDIVSMIVSFVALLISIYAVRGMRVNRNTLEHQQDEINNTFNLVVKLCQKQGWLSKNDVVKALDILLDVPPRSNRILVANKTGDVLLVNKMELKPGATCTATYDSNNSIHIHSNIGSIVLNEATGSYVCYGHLSIKEGPKFHFDVIDEDR